MPNQFYVEPLGGFNLPGAAMGLAQDYRQRKDMREAQEAQVAMRNEAVRVFQSGTPSERAEFLLKNPSVREEFESLEKFKNEKTKSARISGARRILSDEDPEQVIDDIALAIESEGGDPSDVLAFKGRSKEEVKKAALNQLLILDTKAAQAFIESQPKEGGFTLSEGQARYDDEGNIIAYQPKTINALDTELKASKDKFDKASKLRGEFEKVSKVYRDVEDAYGRINAAVEGEPSGASDMALIFNYMKMLDPGSTVREGEFATASQTGGLPARVVNAYNKTVDGKMLTPKQRSQFLDQAKKQFDTASSKHNKRISDYEKLGNRYGLDREDIIVSEVEEGSRVDAPEAAIRMLKSNPDLADQFKAKYGYLPEGFGD